MALSCCPWGPGPKPQLSDLDPTLKRFVNDILELRVLFSELMEVMSRNHYEQSGGLKTSRNGGFEAVLGSRGLVKR